jgi:sporulation protein YlmC with PRC-barrel domain
VLITDSGGHMPEPIGNVLSDRVLTDSGVVIGTVTDVVFESSTNSVVGFERPSRKGR